MAEEKDQQEEKKQEQQQGRQKGIEGCEPTAYVLFLILILLIMGSQNTFNSYFELLNKHTNGIQNIVNMFSTTATGLQSVFQKSPNLQKDDLL